MYKENKAIIPVVMVADRNYRTALTVVIESLLQTANSDTKYDFTIITDELHKEDNYWKEKFPEIELHIVLLDKGELSEAVIIHEGLSDFTYARLLIPGILQEYDKCIYLDTDIVVLSDMSEMYAKNIDEYYIAGVKDYGIQTSKKTREKVQNCMGVESLDKYINAGVLLMNLRKMREDGIQVQFLKNVSQKWQFEDQDIINKCCYDSIGLLPVKYNVLYRYYRRVDFWKTGIYDEQEMNEARYNPAVIHFTGRYFKPWINNRTRACKAWWKVAEQILDKQELKKQKSKCAETTFKMQWEYVLEESKGQEIVVWGYSEKGRALIEWLKNNERNVIGIGDNDECKHGERYDEMQVMNASELVCMEGIKEKLIIISSQGYPDEINRELNELGLLNVIKFYYKNEYYYMALDEKYYEDEIAEIEKKEKITRYNFDRALREKYWMDKWIFRSK